MFTVALESKKWLVVGKWYFSWLGILNIECGVLYFDSVNWSRVFGFWFWAFLRWGGWHVDREERSKQEMRHIGWAGYSSEVDPATGRQAEGMGCGSWSGVGYSEGSLFWKVQHEVEQQNSVSAGLGVGSLRKTGSKQKIEHSRAPVSEGGEEMIHKGIQIQDIRQASSSWSGDKVHYL